MSMSKTQKGLAGFAYLVGTAAALFSVGPFEKKNYVLAGPLAGGSLLLFVLTSLLIYRLNRNTNTLPGASRKTQNEMTAGNSPYRVVGTVATNTVPGTTTFRNPPPAGRGQGKRSDGQVHKDTAYSLVEDGDGFTPATGDTSSQTPPATNYIPPAPQAPGDQQQNGDNDHRVTMPGPGGSTAS